MADNLLENKYDQTVQYLFSQLPVFQRDGGKAFKKDLTNTIRLCEYLGNPHHQFKSVHVAGTNGKGSSSHYLSSVCQSAGYKTGLYTSPHLKRFTERIRINGSVISKEFVVDFVKRIKSIIKEIEPSFFEITVAMAFDYFATQKVDIAIIEVGMGGRLDSTNVILPEVSLITNISYDHQQWLGNSLSEIANEKAGIIKKDREVVISESQGETKNVFQQVATTVNAILSFAEDDYKVINNDGFDVYHKGQFDYKLPRSVGPAYQSRNLQGVLKTIEALNTRGFDISNESVINGLSETVISTGLKGRWQKLGHGPYIYCDVGHNEAGIQFVFEQLKEYRYDKLLIVLGMVNDKDVDQVLCYFPSEAYYYFCQASVPRALDAYRLQSFAKKYELKGEVVQDVNKALEKAKNKANETDFIFIGGSNFVVAEIENL